ncbi:hypothetical protein [Comamonas guangdongensis]|uniref:DUF892 family protein n=1 Tax=Comamonas guangdongensis TaxID=510515 RepID=A0ABV3ZNV0_9BURK
MILQKTAKALEELQPGKRQLPQRARSVLLVAGGKSLDEIRSLLGADHAELAQQLVAQGYLQLASAHSPGHSAKAQAGQIAPPATAEAAGADQAPPAINMAGTRMYLFDLCERLFANRHEALAQALRTQLREARDLPTLRDAGLSLLAAVQEHAGEERAQSLQERLAALLAHGAGGEALETGAA